MSVRWYWREGREECMAGMTHGRWRVWSRGTRAGGVVSEAAVEARGRGTWCALGGCFWVIGSLVELNEKGMTSGGSCRERHKRLQKEGQRLFSDDYTGRAGHIHTMDGSRSMTLALPCRQDLRTTDDAAAGMGRAQSNQAVDNGGAAFPWDPNVA